MQEMTFLSAEHYRQPFLDAELSGVFMSAEGQEIRVPGFWAGGNVWKLRFAPPTEGVWRLRTVCSDESNEGLHGRTEEIGVAPYTGDNDLLERGRLRVSEDRRHLEYGDGTPFFWLADTWWMGLCDRLSWPDDFKELTADRVRKGFNVIQIVAGLYPDMPPTYDERGANEAGFPLNPDHSIVNPAYFDMADLRIAHLVHSRLAPAILFCWGYWLLELGEEKMRRFIRYVVARWGAHPVVWCMAGEGTMPYYLSKDKVRDAALQREGWTRMARFLREIDGHGSLVTIHPPTGYGRDQVEDDSLLDFEWLQTGHSGYLSLGNNVEHVLAAAARRPRMPVLVSEANYEGIRGMAWQDVQRISFWSAVLSGSCGYSYGANGIWQVNLPAKPFGPSPHDRSWGDMPWQDAASLAGSGQIGAAARFLRGLPWHALESHPEWVGKPASKENAYMGAFCAGTEDLRIVYVPNQWMPPRVLGLPAGSRWSVEYFNPVDGTTEDMGVAVAEDEGTFALKSPEVMHDWVYVAKRVK